MNEDAASAITDALSESARHLWFAVMLARHGNYASAREMRAAAREVSDAIAATMQMPPVADLIYAEMNDIVDAVITDSAKASVTQIH